MKQPVGIAEVRAEARSRLRIGDYYVTYTRRMRSEAERFAELAAQTAR